jgi:lipopolysaccharide export LptBFGC system permease protein LptF
VLGQQNYLPPFMGGAVPSLAFLWLGAWQMYRKR